MRGMTNLSFFLYTVILLAAGAILLTLALDLLPGYDVSGLFERIRQNMNVRLILGAVGAILIVTSVGLVQFVLGKIQRERTIAFSNPDGQVTISLSAIEDFIKKTARQLPEVKELRSDVVASKKGLDIYARAVLWSDTSIPDTTEKIQSMIKTKLLDMIGIEESITVKVHIIKIAQKEETAQKPQEKEAPYRGIEYR